MAEIHVVFPEGDQSPTIVYSDPKAVVGGRFINWHVHSYNPKVKEVKIDFEGRQMYFPVKNANGNNTRRSWYTKAIRKTHGGQGECTIWGQAPDKHTKKETHKYTVYGLDKNGDDAVPPLDPEIINDPPKRP